MNNENANENAIGSVVTSSNCRGLLRVLTRVNLNPADFENLLILFIYHLV